MQVWKEVALVHGSRREVEVLFLVEDFYVCAVQCGRGVSLCFVDCMTLEAWMTGTDNVLAFLGDHFEPRVRRNARVRMDAILRRMARRW